MLHFYFILLRSRREKEEQEDKRIKQEPTGKRHVYSLTPSNLFILFCCYKSLSFSGKTCLAFEVRRVFTTIGFISIFKVDPNRLGWKSTFHVIFKFRFRLHMISVLCFTFTKILLYINIIRRMSGCFNKYVLISLFLKI